MKEWQRRWVNNEQTGRETEGRRDRQGRFQLSWEIVLQMVKRWQNPVERIDEWSREKHIVASPLHGALNIWLPASWMSEDAAGRLSRSPLLREAVQPGSLRRYSYIMGCLKHWHCSILINYLTAYIRLLRHLVNGLQQGMSNPILQLERFTNFLQEVCNIIT